MYIKVNTNVECELCKLNKLQFQNMITKAFSEAIKKTGIQSKGFLDDSGTMGIYNLEVSYL